MQDKFSARASALGYYYQVRYALFVLLFKGQDEPNLEMSIENLDDISFEKEGTPLELLQTKHKINSIASLSNSSSDLWKTLRIWSTAILEGRLNLNNNIIYTLVTTAKAPDGSAASKLRKDANRSVDNALRILLDVALASSDKSNKPAYDSFIRLGEKFQRKLLSCVYIIDSSPNILDVQENIQFRNDNLPIDFLDPVDLLEDELDINERVFILQLRLIMLQQPRIQKAISDYYRAYQQRSKWIREELTLVGELERYEKRLIDEWERFFLIMKEDIGNNPDEEKMINEGRALFNIIETKFI